LRRSVPRCAYFALLLPAALAAQTASQPASRPDAAKELAALMAKVEAAPNGKKPAELTAEVRTFIASCAHTEEALTAKLWLLRDCWWERQEGTMEASADKCLEDILAHHAGSKQLWKIADSAFLWTGERRIAVLERLLNESPHGEVKAAALLALGTAELRGKDEASRKKGRERMEALARDHAKMPSKYTTYGELADAMLHPHAAADLKPGKPAPEIEGKDLDGKSLRLSDFKGKVVLLDFWGDW
jgi:hypothetical protein